MNRIWMDRQIDRRDGFKRSSTCHLFDIIIVSLLLLSLSFLLLLSLSILLLLLLLLLLFLLLLLSFLSSLSLLFLMLLFVCPIVDLLFDAPPLNAGAVPGPLCTSPCPWWGETLLYINTLLKKTRKSDPLYPTLPYHCFTKAFWTLVANSVKVAFHSDSVACQATVMP